MAAETVIWAFAGAALLLSMGSVLWPYWLSHRTAILRRFQESSEARDGFKTMRKLTPVFAVSASITASASFAFDILVRGGDLSPWTGLLAATTVLSLCVGYSAGRTLRMISPPR